MTLIILLQLFSFKIKGEVFIAENKKMAEAIKVYQLLLEGKEIEEVKKTHEVGEGVQNYHQALDYIIYLTERNLPKKLFGQKFNSCRADLNQSDELGLFIESIGNIDQNIDREYENEWVYEFPERTSCYLCLNDESCKEKSDSWKRTQLTDSNPYREFQKSKQKELCLEMSSYAHNQASTGVVISGGEKKVCPSSAICPSKNPYWETVYYFDFKQCQNDFLVCPRIEESDRFIHPSCFSENVSDSTEKIKWLGAQANSVLSKCKDFPFYPKKMRPELITCLEGNDSQKLEGLINIDMEALQKVQMTAPILEMLDNKGQTSRYWSPRFFVELDKQNKDIRESEIKFNEIKRKYFQLGERYYNKALKAYEYKMKNGSSPEEFERIKNEFIIVEQIYEDKVRRRKQLIDSELATFDSSEDGDYPYNLRILHSSNHGGIENKYNFSSGIIKEARITEGRNSEFPANSGDQKLLLAFLTQQIKNYILEKEGTKTSPELMATLSEAWALRCVQNKFDDLGCHDKIRTSPRCHTCKKELTQADLDPQHGEIPETQEGAVKRFYQQRRCLEYEKEFQNVVPKGTRNRNREKLCSKDFYKSNKSLKKYNPVRCDETNY